MKSLEDSVKNKSISEIQSKTILGKTNSPQDKVWHMFDRIAPRYDLLNRMLSLRRDVVWRKKLTGHLSDKSDQIVLDLATGTADVLLSLFKYSHNLLHAIGIDLALEMLKYGRQKTLRNNLDTAIKLIPGDAGSIPFSDNQFDVVTIAFGIRNVMDVHRCLAEILRVLKPGGRLLVLEFSLPGNKFIKNIYLFYFRNVLPRIGNLISGDKYAYHYLNRTVESFPYGNEFCDLLSSAGYKNSQIEPLSFGIASIYLGEKPL
jgi:demethylmenaquinone methyltransferase/2-methoxy-6-polyprenyl-1,4-benzoquinol methylase